MRTRFPRQVSAEKEEGDEGQGLEVIARSKIYDVENIIRKSDTTAGARYTLTFAIV